MGVLNAFTKKLIRKQIFLFVTETKTSHSNAMIGLIFVSLIKKQKDRDF